jgi:hypothetical protein
MGFPLISPFLQFFDNAGAVLEGGKLFSYAPGTSTKKTTWSDADQNTENTNPIILDSAGRASIFLQDGEEYKFVLCPADDTDPPTNPIRTYDDVKSPTDLAAADIAELIFPRTSTENATGITPTNYAYPSGDIRRYGAVGNDSTDCTTAIQNCITVCERSSLEMFVAEGVFRHTALTIANASYDGFRIRGVSTGDYGTSAGNAPTRGSILKYTGSGTGITVDAAAATTSPKYVTFDSVTILGNSNADDGVLITRSTWCRFRHCTITGFDQANGNGVRLTIGTGTFTGGIRFFDCDLKECYRAVYVDTYPVNLVSFLDCGFHSNTYDFVAGPDTSTINFIRQLRFVNCDFEETAKSAILINGGIAGGFIVNNYFEQNDVAENDPRVWFANTGTSPLSQALNISDNDFSKVLQAAGQALVRIRNTKGLVIRNNWSAAPTSGTVSDRYSVELVSTVSEFEVESFLTVFGATPYPTWYSSSTYTITINSKDINFLGTNVQRNGLEILTTAVTVNTQSSAYTIAAVDAGINKLLVNGGSSNTYTLDDFATVPIAVGSVVPICNAHASTNLTISRSGPALYLGNTNQNLTIAPRRIVYLRHISTDVWVVEDTSGLT